MVGWAHPQLDLLNPSL